MPRKSLKASKAPVTTVQDPARKAWLAALGAVALVKQRSEVAVNGLIEESLSLQSRAIALRDQARTLVRQRVDAVIQPINAAIAERAEAATSTLEYGVGVVLGRLGVPSKADIAELSQRVSALSRQLRAASR